jgi:hypothetical protein
MDLFAHGRNLSTSATAVQVRQGAEEPKIIHTALFDTPFIHVCREITCTNYQYDASCRISLAVTDRKDRHLRLPHAALLLHIIYYAK